MSRPRPLVGIPANIIDRPEREIPAHITSDNYIDALIGPTDAVPVVIPALGEAHDFADLAGRLDGLFLTGGRANIEPHYYAGAPFPDDEPIDPRRDATALPLIRECIDQGVPVFAVCRGLQEINVALGGSLHYRVHHVDGKLDHRMPRVGDFMSKFAPRHSVSLAPGGAFADLVLFDPHTIEDRATFEAPAQPAAGISQVMVNGQAVWRDGEATGARAGRVLRRGYA